MCGRPFSEECVVAINGTPDQIGDLRAKLEARREALKAKKGRKRKLAALVGSSSNSGQIKAVQLAGS